MKRGDIYYVERSGLVEIGSEQHSGRPAIIVSNDLLNDNSEVVEIVYLTLSPKKPMPTHRQTTATGKLSTIICEQINTVSKSRLANYIGHIDDVEMLSIDNALKCSLGLISGEPRAAVGKLEQNAELVKLTETLNDTRKELSFYKEMYDRLLDRLTPRDIR